MPVMRPIVQSAPLSEFGDLLESAQFLDENAMDRDLSYVPGFAEMRRTHEIQRAEYHQGKRAAADVLTLPVNTRWAKVQSLTGAPDSKKPFQHAAKGYKLTTKDMVGQDWLTSLPPGASVMPDGSIRNGDCVLMYCDKQQAAKNELQKRLNTERRVTGMRASFAQALETAKRQNPGLAIKGTAPYVEQIHSEDISQTKRGPGRPRKVV